MKTLIRLNAAAAAVVLGLTAVRAELIETSFAEASARIVEMKALAKEATPKKDGMAIVDKRIRYKASLKMLLGRQKCSSQFEQVNGREPLALCAVDAGVPGVVKPITILPFGLHGEFDSEIGTDVKVGCTGGIRGDAGLTSQFQVFVALTPPSFDYSKAQFQECFESVIAKLSAKDRVMYFDATQAAE